MNAESSVVASGIPGLDGILGGGLPTEGVIFVVGAPGTGKTVLLQQLAFQAAAAGRTALYFSGFSEPHERLLEHLRPLAFFDDKLLGRRLHLLSLAATLVENPADAVSTVVQTARRTGASLVLVDGFLGLQGLFQGETAAVQFLYTLGAQLGMVRALLVVAVEADPRAVSLYPVVAVGDALLALYLERAVVGHRRYLEVLKRRGAEPLLGLHTFTISRAGLRCYPQFELTVPPVDNAFDSTQRAPFDLPEFDALLQGGVTRQTTTILTGSPGTGKTLLGLQFLAAGVARGETGVLLSFHETRAQLLDKAAAHGIALAEAIARDQIRLLLQSPVAFDPDILAQQLQVALNETRASRLVVDSVRDLEASLPHDRVDAYLAAIVTLIRGLGVTAILTREITRVFSLDVDFASLAVSVLAENVVVLRQIPARGELHRVLAVLKMRFSAHDQSFREFTITEQGLQVLGRWESAPEVLAVPTAGDEPAP